MPILPENAITKNVKTFDLTSSVNVAKDNGTVSGSPTFSRDGCDMDGSNDYITYAIPNTLMSSAKISIVVEFTPDFDYDANNTYYFFDSTNLHRYLLVKRNNANSNTLALYLGHTDIVTIPQGNYSSYWKQNERNVIEISGTSGNTSVWLNGNLIIDSDNTAWTPKNPTELYVGVNYAGSSKFDGEIHSVSIYNDLLTGEEAEALYDNSLYNFQNKSDVWLDMKSQSSDGSNTITKDVSGNGNDFLLGDGSDTATFPDFSNPGFDFDGVSHYLSNENAEGIYNNTYQTIVMCFKPDFEAGDGNPYYIFDATANKEYLLIKRNTAGNNDLRLLLGDTFIGDVGYSTYEPYWNTHGLNVLVVTATSGDTDIYLNGVKLMDADNTAWSPANPASIYVGQDNNNSNQFDGEIYHFSTYGNKFAQKMSGVQVRQITSDLFNKYS